MRFLDELYNRFWSWHNNRINETALIEMWQKHYPPNDRHFEEVLDRRINHLTDWPCCCMIMPGGHNDVFWHVSWIITLLKQEAEP